MTEIYPYLGLWAYLKFHFIDGITKQSIMLLDKTRVDYDSKGKKEKYIDAGNTMTEEELNAKLLHYGFGTNASIEGLPTLELTREQRAEIISNELNNETT